MSRIALLGLALLTLSGCATLVPPSADKLASLPVVEFPAAPPEGEFILRLPAGKAIPTRVLIDGTALASHADQTLSVTLPGDLYVHRRWVSTDGKTWKPLKDMLDIRVALSLPSDEHPKPGELRLSVDRATP